MDWKRIWLDKIPVRVEISREVKGGFLGYIQDEKVFLPQSLAGGFGVGDEVEAAIVEPPTEEGLAVASVDWLIRQSFIKSLFMHKRMKGRVIEAYRNGFIVDLGDAEVEIKTSAIQMEIGETVFVKPVAINREEQTVRFALC